MKCRNCGDEVPRYIYIDGIKKNLQRRTLCLTCLPFKSGRFPTIRHPAKRTKPVFCKICQRETKTGFLCNSCRTRIRRFQAKTAAVKYKGERCSRCGWTGHISAFEFHHVDPDKKSFTIGNASNKSWQVIVKELDKCEMLCANCHRIEHTADRDLTFLAIAETYKGRVFTSLAL